MLSAIKKQPLNSGAPLKNTPTLENPLGALHGVTLGADGVPTAPGATFKLTGN